MFSDIGVVIPVRLGSSRIEQKALLEFNGTNLLEWKISQLKRVIDNKNIYVSTESSLLKDIAYSNDVNVHHRDYYLADGHKAAFSEVITGVVKDIPYEHIAWITTVVPLMSPDEYKKGFELYIQNVINSNKYDSLFASNLLKEYLWDETKPINYQADKNHTISQHLPNIYQVTNGLYMRDRESILKENYFLGKKTFKYEVSKLAAIDIDEYEDYEIAKALIPIYNKKVQQ